MKLFQATLPRHTILAKQSSRIAAATLDFAIACVFTLIFFFGCFNLIFTSCFLGEINNRIMDYEINSHLVTYNASTGRTEAKSSDADYKVYEDSTRYYYLSYLINKDIEVPTGGDLEHPEKYAAPDWNTPIKKKDNILPKDYYTVSWYNENVLGIDPKNDPMDEKSTTYFTYQTDGEGKYDLNKVGVPKTKRYNPDKQQVVDITNVDITSYMKTPYVNAYYNLIEHDFYSNDATKSNFYYGLEGSITIILGGFISYVLFPLIFKDGQTIGKKILKLGLASFEGYKVKKYQILLRFIPYLITSCSLMLISVNSIVIPLLIVLVMVLVSFALAMASPRRSALHDYCGHTLVVDIKESTLFKSSIEEEIYLEAEEEK